MSAAAFKHLQSCLLVSIGIVAKGTLVEQIWPAGIECTNSENWVQDVNSQAHCALSYRSRLISPLQVNVEERPWPEVTQ